MIPCGDSLFTFPSCKRSCSVPSVCHADANKPLQVAMATRLIRNGLMLGLILSNFPSLGRSEMVKGLKDSELPNLRENMKEKGQLPCEIGPESLSEHSHHVCLHGLWLVWRTMHECQKRALQPGRRFQLGYLSRAIAQPTAPGCPASASFEKSTNHSRIKNILFLLLPVLITVERILTEQLHRENTCKRGGKKAQDFTQMPVSLEGLGRGFQRALLEGLVEYSCSVFNNSRSITSHLRR